MRYDEDILRIELDPENVVAEMPFCPGAITSMYSPKYRLQLLATDTTTTTIIAALGQKIRRKQFGKTP
jgi:hypothetical protein